MNENTVLRIFEDRQCKLRVSQQNIEDLLGMRNIIGENNIIIQADGRILIRHFIGFIQLNKTRLLIYPKIAVGLDNDDEFSKSFEILLKMLVYSGFAGIKRIPEAQNIAKYQGDLMELYIGMFAKELLRQFQRDINRGYNNQLENQCFIKGKVDFNETIKHNSFKKHLHYVRYDEFDENTSLNTIFKAIIQVLILKTKVKSNKIKLMQLMLWLEDVKDSSLTNDIWDSIIFNRQNRKYEVAFNMAKMFYYKSGPNIISGNTSALSFLIPTNQLFEMYLYKILEKGYYGKYEVKYQGPIDYLAVLNDRSYLQMKPDITLLKDGKVDKIIDAKYKIIMDENENLLTSQGDVYQMLAYSVRYQCDDIYLIYPKGVVYGSEGVAATFTIENYDHHITVHIIKIDLEDQPDVTIDKIVNYITTSINCKEIGIS